MYECSKSVQVLMRNSKQFLDSNTAVLVMWHFDAHPPNRRIILIQIHHTLPKSVPINGEAGIKQSLLNKLQDWEHHEPSNTRDLIFQARFLETKDPRRSGDPEGSKI